jgi:ribose transport system ATP-binding protein
MNREAQGLLDKYGFGRIKASAMVDDYNFEDRKLVEIVKATYFQPKIVVIDETTTALSQEGREELYKQMNRIRSEGNTIIFISHDLDEIKQVCDTLTVLRDGKIITHFSKENYDDDAIKASMIGREMQGDYYRPDNEPTWQEKVLLKAEHLTGSGLKDISLEIRAGEILGIGGLSECGMHTLGKALFGSAMLTGGTVTVEGKHYSDPQKATRLGVGYVSKERDTESLCQQASIRDNIAIGGLQHIQKKKLILKKRETAYVQKQVDALSIKCRHMEQPVSAMSGGNKQKVVFGKWLGAGSRILILDCPTRGVDIGVKQSMYQLIAKMKNEGKAILIISEEMTELIGMCDRLLVMKDGAVQKEFLRGNMNEADIIRYMI